MKHLRYGTVGFISFLIGGFLCGNAKASPLSTEISSISAVTDQLNVSVGSLTVDVPAAFARLKSESNMDKGPLIVGGVQASTAPTTISWPISYVANTFFASALQFDIATSSGISVISVTAGPAAIAAGKSVTFTPANGRNIIFGLNQNSLGTGVIAIAQVQISTIPTGFYSMALVNPVASDPSGNQMLISTVSGTLKIQ